MLFSERLKEVREKNKISMRKLAEDMGISVSNISFYESGKSVPSIEVLFNFARYFQISTDYLLGLTDEPLGNTPDDVKQKLLNLQNLENENLKLREAIEKAKDNLNV